MWWRNVPRQLSAVVIGSVCLGGCGEFSPRLGYTGVGIPAPSDIAAFYDETDKGSVLSNGSRLTAGDYLLASMTYTNEKCHVFFEQLEYFKQDSQFLDKVLTAAIAAGSPLLSLSSSAAAVANIASGVASANLLNKYSADIYAFAAFKEPLQDHVFSSMADYQAKKGLDLFSQWQFGIEPTRLTTPAETETHVAIQLNTNPRSTIFVNKKSANDFIHSSLPSHLLIARSIAADYASICSLANMRRIMEASLNATTSKSNTTGNPTAPSSSSIEMKPEKPAPTGGKI